jgi:hypothetical protein
MTIKAELGFTMVERTPRAYGYGIVVGGGCGLVSGGVVGSGALLTREASQLDDDRLPQAYVWMSLGKHTTKSRVGDVKRDD